MPKLIPSQLRAIEGDSSTGRPQTTDRELLERFVRQGDCAAFAGLVDRHAEFLLGQCRRWTNTRQDAEDVVQAAFLVLARTASSIRRRDNVAAWLYRVAKRMARQTRLADAARRRRDQKAGGARRDRESSSNWENLLLIMDEEMEKLDQRLRSVLQLCYLQGRTQEEAARELSCSLSTVRRRLSEGRDRLRERMEVRGASLHSGRMVALLGLSAWQVPLSSGASTFLSQLAAGSTRPETSATVASLAQGAIAVPMFVKALTVSLLVVAMSAILLVGAGRFLGASTEREPENEFPRVDVPDQVPQGRVDFYGDALPDAALARIGTTRFTDYATVLAFSPDNKFLAYGLDSGAVKICDPVSGKLLLQITAHPSYRWAATELAFSHNSRLLAVGSRFWDVIHIYDLDARKHLFAVENPSIGEQRLAHERTGPAFAFTPDDQALIVGGKNGTVYIVNAKTGKDIAALSDGLKRIRSISLSADGKVALTIHESGEVHLWDIERQSHLQKHAANTYYPELTALSPNGQTIAVASDAKNIELWSRSSERLHRLSTEGEIAGLGFTKDGRHLQAIDVGGTISTWDVQTGRTFRTVAPKEDQWQSGRLDRPQETQAWFDHDGKFVALNQRGVISVLETATGAASVDLPMRGGIQWAGFSADGKSARTLGVGGKLAEWDASTGRQIGETVKSPLDWNTHLATSQGRDILAAVTGSKSPDSRLPGSDNRQRLFLWRPASQKAPQPLPNQAEPASGVSLILNGGQLLTKEKERFRIYDVAQGNPIRSIDCADKNAIFAASPNGKYLAYAEIIKGAQSKIHLFDLQSGRAIGDWLVQGITWNIAFSPSGRFLATHQSDALMKRTEADPPVEAITLWEIPNGKKLFAIGPDVGAGNPLAFSPDEKLLSSCTYKGPLILWETATGRERQRLVGHVSRVTSLDFSPDGRRLVSSSMDGTALVWQIAPEK